MENVFLVANTDSMARIGSSLIPGNDVGMLGKHIDNLAFAFVTPLGANNYLNGHAGESMKWVLMNTVDCEWRSKKNPTLLCQRSEKSPSYAIIF